MGLRDKRNSTRRLAIQKETLRKLALRPLDDEQLRAVNGGEPTGTGTQAPSYCRC